MKVSFEGAATWGVTVARRVAGVFASNHLYALTAESYAIMEGYNRGQSSLTPVTRPEGLGSSAPIAAIPSKMPTETDSDLVPIKLGRSTMGDVALLGHPDFIRLVAEKTEQWQKQPDPANLVRLNF